MVGWGFVFCWFSLLGVALIRLVLFASYCVLVVCVGLVWLFCWFPCLLFVGCWFVADCAAVLCRYVWLRLGCGAAWCGGVGSFRLSCWCLYCRNVSCFVLVWMLFCIVYLVCVCDSLVGLWLGDLWVPFVL